MARRFIMTFNVSMEVNKPYLKAFRDRIFKLARILFTEAEWTDFTVNLDSLNCALKANLSSFLDGDKKTTAYAGSYRGRGRGSFRGRNFHRGSYYGGTNDARFSYSGGYSKRKFNSDLHCSRCSRLAQLFLKFTSIFYKI